MAPLTLEMRHDSEGAIECWDDDDDLQCYEDIHLRATSSAASVTTSSVRRSGHRDSISSRLSARSDLDSTAGGDEDWQIQLLDDNELVDEEAISSVKNAGIPLPASVPRSALIGGTIKRLGKRKTKREFIDDWSDDLELPSPDVALELKRFPDTSFPETLLQIGSASGSPVKSASPSSTGDVAHQLSGYTISDGFPDNIDTDSTLDVPTVKATGQQSSLLPGILGDSMSRKEQISIESFDDDFELPTGGFLQLRHPSARNSSPTPEDLDVDWSEGSIGVRFGGTARDHRSNPSSSISVVSPSASSYLTGESDDEGLDGLVIPEGPLDLGARLNKPRNLNPADVAHRVPDDKEKEQSHPDDFFSGLEINNGEAFNFKKPSINPNIKCKTEPLGSPARRSATTLTFTNATVSPKTRIPRLSGHERPLSTHLETVSESGAPLSKFRTSPRRPGHVSHSSVSSLPISASTTLSSNLFTPKRRLVGTRVSKDPLPGERAAGKQLLKSKRSMPSMRNTQQATPATSLSSPPRPQGGPSWSTSRLWTPVDRTANSPAASMRKPQTPFLPAGTSEQQSHHASIKNYRYSRRTSSDGTGDTFSSQSTVIRLPRSSRHDHPFNPNDTTSEKLNTTPKRTLTRPTRRRNYGDGSELASFDDLPTSTATESRFVKQPSGRGAPRSLRNKLSQSQPALSKQEGAPQERQATTSPPPYQQTLVPRFARDTNASRNAREQRIASMSSTPKLRENTPLTPLSSNWKPQNISRVPSTTGLLRNKKGKSGSISSTRPQLIKPIGAGVQEAKSVNGMHYNPASFRWEGNENLVRGFDTATPKSPKSSPALITNVGAMQNVQVVGGMVFDPQRMCWLKLAPSQPGVDGAVVVEDEDDVFSNLADLEESGASGKKAPGTLENFGPAGSGDDRSGEDSSDEWPITEEFDVGPEFIRRQHTEEEKWRRKVDKWINHNHAGFGSSWRWAIRDLVRFNSTLGAQELNNA
ncbi:hypothetical protein BJX63DRAFT_91790 [Aspergillus granulosus]|uniref:Cytokinesis regulator (Byr4) n=1 Tax=Aspergillus granulosus TaxID=176169 RepID=A0ABR4GV20_9EURO